MITPTNKTSNFPFVGSMSQTQTKGSRLASILMLTLFTLGYSAKHAILIGVGEYPFGQVLGAPPRDVALMRETLESKKFAVRAALNPNAGEMTSFFDEWLASINDGDECVFFYSGHGAQVGSTRYISGNDQKLVDGKYQGMVPLIDFQHKLQIKNPAGTKVFILDSCASQPRNDNGSLKVVERSRILNGEHREQLRNTYFFGAKTGSMSGMNGQSKIGYISEACALVIQESHHHLNLQTFEKNTRVALGQHGWEGGCYDAKILELRVEWCIGPNESLPAETEALLRGQFGKDVESRISELSETDTSGSFFRFPEGQQKSKSSPKIEVTDKLQGELL